MRTIAVGNAYSTVHTALNNATFVDVAVFNAHSTITVAEGDTARLYFNGVRNSVRRNARTFRTVGNNVAVGDVVSNISKDVGSGCGVVASVAHGPDEPDHTGVDNIRARKLFQEASSPLL